MSVKLYNFHKANSNFDKGDRDDSSVSVLAVAISIWPGIGVEQENPAAR